MNSLVRLPIAAVTLVVTLLFAPVAFAIDSGDIVVASIKGEVQVTMNGAPRSVRAGAVLELPATVRTGRDGNIELRQGATSVSVGPETLLEFPALAKRGDPVDRIQQPRGNAFYDIGKREGRRLRIETPYLVGVVKGTQFNVAAQDESTTISLFEGLLEVRASDDSDVVELKAGEIASRKRGDKTISVIKMDGGKAPPTQRAPAGNSSGGSGTPPPAPPARGTPASNDGDSLLAGRDLNVLPVVSTVVDSVNDAGVSAGGAVAPINATVEVRPAIELVTPAAIDVGVNVNPGGSSLNVDVGASAVVDLGTKASVDVGAAVGVDVGRESGMAASVDVNAGVNAGPAAVDANVTAAVDLGGSSVNVDVGASAAVDLGTAASVDVGTAVGVDVGRGAGAAASVDVNAGVNAGPLSTDAGAGVAVDLGGDRGAANVDLGVNGNLGNALGADAAVAVNVGPAATVDAGANVAGVNAGVTTGVDVGAGNVDLGVNVAGLNLGLGVDLGLGLGAGTTPDTGTPATPTTPAPETTPTVDLGGLLDGLLRKPGRRR